MIINLFIYIPLTMFFLASFVYTSSRKHLLVTLLRLEYLILSLFLFIYLFLVNNNLEMYFIIMFLVLRVCEGALGLSILVSIIRTHGNNYFQSFSSLIC